MRARVLAFVVLLAVPATHAQQTTPLPALDRVIEDAIRDKKLPGAVVVIGKGDTVLYRKAYGNRALVPAVEPMTVDTVFDVASLTKVIATTTAVMQQVEQGKIRLDDRVADYIPGFGQYGKERITVRHLLTHMSGLRPDLDLSDEFEGRDTAIRYALEEIPSAAPGRRFIYSDINFFLLADIVARTSGMPFERYVRERIFVPLGMKDTMFLPPASMGARIAPTQPCEKLAWPCGANAPMLRGVVHDPTARRMDGVAGHAGLFGTADDLVRFARLLLNKGTLDGARVLSPLSVERMTSPATPPGEANVRGLGWDIASSFSSNRGDLLPLGSFGHTGFTGTSIWIDPASRLFVIFMSNRVHPDGKGDVTPLRARVATLAAAAFIDSVPEDATFARGFFESAPATSNQQPTTVLTGLDVLAANGFAQLKGRRVGLITNHTGRSRTGAPAIDLLHKAPGVTLVALFSPEHGIRGILDATVPSSVDETTDLTIHSLYGETRRPTDAMLNGIDTLVFDLQDIGARFYTYITTMAYAMEEAAKRNIRVVVLDRPNPINGFAIEGPALDEEAVGFTGYMSRMPIRHGMTLGELARLFNAENKIGADLQVIEMRGWRRDAWYDETRLPWINPSPNMRNLIQATLYPGIGAFESANISVGRGTDTPFEHIGAPWIDGPALADALNARQLPGVSFYPVRFTPTASKFAKEECQGVFILVLDREAVRPVRVGVEIAAALTKLHGATFEIDRAARLFGSARDIARIKAGDDPAAIATGWTSAEARWRRIRAKYLLY
ncbi:MAG: exo-beta-N-acetylmuramidase NamZ domain-containing protein [Vicinamibacterales bacterium]